MKRRTFLKYLGVALGAVAIGPILPSPPPALTTKCLLKGEIGKWEGVRWIRRPTFTTVTLK